MLTDASHPPVAVVVVGTNERKWLEVCFASLLASDYPALRLIYVDNDSHDGSAALVSDSFKRVEVVRNERNLGFAGANNVGIRAALDAATKYVFLVNPDTRTPPGLVRSLAEFMEQHGEYGIVGPMQCVYGGADDPPVLNEWSQLALENGERHAFYHWEPWRPGEAGPQSGRAPATLEHAYVQGAAFFVRREVLDAVGLFDETFHTFYEEVDLCRRARWAGYRVALLLDLFIQHKGGGGSKATNSFSRYRNYHYTRNKYYYLLTDPGYDLRQACALCWRWLKYDTVDALTRRTGNIHDCRQFLSILWWLLRHAALIRRERRKRLELFSARARRSGGGGGREFRPPPDLHEERSPSGLLPPG
jgi:hypothetical protein